MKLMKNMLKLIGVATFTAGIMAVFYFLPFAAPQQKHTLQPVAEGFNSGENIKFDGGTGSSEGFSSGTKEVRGVGVTEDGETFYYLEPENSYTN